MEVAKMASREELQSRLEFRKAALDEARKAYLALLRGQVQSYSIGSRNLTRLDLEKLNDEINELEKKVDDLERTLSGGQQRRAVGVVLRDW